jgi:peroxiredoxin
VLRPAVPLPTQRPPFPDRLPTGAVAPEWSVVGWTDGQARQLADYRGKVLVLNFWGSDETNYLYCVPVMKQLMARYAGRQDVVFLGIHLAGTDVAKVKQFEQTKDWQLVTAVDQGPAGAPGATARAYGIETPSVVLVIGRDGKMAPMGEDMDCNSPEYKAWEAGIHKALNLPAEKPDDSFKKKFSAAVAMMVYEYGQWIDGALAAK